MWLHKWNAYHWKATTSSFPELCIIFCSTNHLRATWHESKHALVYKLKELNLPKIRVSNNTNWPNYNNIWPFYYLNVGFLLPNEFFVTVESINVLLHKAHMFWFNHQESLKSFYYTKKLANFSSLVRAISIIRTHLESIGM